MGVLWVKFHHLHTPIRRSDLGKLILIGLFAISFNIGFGFVGIKLATALDSITFASMTPIAIALASVVFLGERMTKLNTIGQLVAFFGALAVINSPTGQAPDRMLGDILLALSGLSWVTSIILSKELFHRYHSFTITSVFFMVGIVTFALPAAGEYLQNPGWVGRVDPLAWAGVVFLAVFTSVVAYLAYEWGLEHSSASYAGVIEHFQLIIGAVAASLLLGEILSGGYVLGASLILIGIVLATRPSHHYRKAHAR